MSLVHKGLVHKGLAFAAALSALASPARAQGLISVHDLSLDAAHEIAQTALETCRKNGFKITVTVLDRAGGLLVVLHDNGAGLHTIENSRRKAYTARTFNSPSSVFAARYAAKPAEVSQVTLPNIVAAGGAFPIKAGDEVVGSVGVSGSPGSDKDEACAKAGIDKVADQLK